MLARRFAVASIVRRSSPETRSPVRRNPSGASAASLRQAFEAARQADLQSNDDAVKAAAAAYGDQGVDNGIAVGFGNLAPGTAGTTTPQLQGNADGTMGMTASVMFQTGVRGTELRSAVGHEGTHVLNAQGFASSFTTNAASWDLTRNLTAFQTETNAFRITHSIYRSANQTFNAGCTGCTLGAGQTLQPTLT